MITIDTETCGLHGMPVLIQWAEDKEPVHLHDIWLRPIKETLKLIEMFCENHCLFFNGAFDWFMLTKCYTTFQLYPDHNATPIDIIDELATLEERARFSNVCLKPKSCFDVMLYARKGPYQSLMERDDIRIRRVPTAIAWNLARELERRVKFDEIYFARAKDRYAPRWKVYDIKSPEGVVNPDFKDIRLNFQASGSLKNLYRHAFGEKEIILFGDIEVDKALRPVELGYAPFALAIGNRDDWKGAWPEVITHHINHWGYHKKARQYASDDVDYTRRLYYEHFESPPFGDNDSELSCAVAACRWRGYAIDVPRLRRLREDAEEKIQHLLRAAGVGARKRKKDGKRHAAMPTGVAKKYITAVMGETEKACLHGSTKRVILEEIAEWQDDCPACVNGVYTGEVCATCHGTQVIPHQAAVRARQVLDARQAEKEIEIYDKLLRAGRFHASFKVIGTLSSRMSGTDGLNPQGIKAEANIRAAFTLADTVDSLMVIELVDGSKVGFTTLAMSLSGGDFKAFEVALAAKVFNDPALDAAINSGKKIHALLAMELFPGQTYEQIRASDGTKNDMYKKGKSGVFLMFYGGDENTFKNKLGIPIEIGKPAFDRFINKFKGIKRFGEQVTSDFGSLTQSGGIGTKIDWREPKDYAESFLGFKRYFTLENRVAKTLFQMAQNPPASLKNVKIKVMRRDRVQTAGGAAQSALYGAAFGIVSAIMRAAKNHYIQSPGAEITKATQRALWDLQPSGVQEWVVQPLNVHDEIMAPVKPGMEMKVKEVVDNTVEKYKALVPLLAIDWVSKIPNWAGKKG